MDVHVPESRQQERAVEIDDVGASRVGRAAAVEHLHDAAALDRHAGAGHGPWIDAVDQRRVGQNPAHRLTGALHGVARWSYSHCKAGP